MDKVWEVKKGRGSSLICEVFDKPINFKLKMSAFEIVLLIVVALLVLVLVLILLAEHVRNILRSMTGKDRKGRNFPFVKLYKRRRN